MNDDRENRRARRARPESRGATQVVQVKMPRLLAGDTSGLRIQLLGHFRVWIGSREIEDGEWFLHKVQHLVKLLALAPDHRLHRRQLMYVLWPEMDPDAAATTLYKGLHLVRRILEPDLPTDRPSSYLHLCGEFVILQSPRSLWIDVEAFQAAAAVARQSGSLDAYEETLRWYGGDLLPQDPYEAWAIRQREELAALHQHLLLELASLYEQAGKMSQAADILWQMATGEPAHGEGQARLIALVARSESPQVAVDQDELLQLQHNVGVEPGPSGQEIVIAKERPGLPHF